MKLITWNSQGLKDGSIRQLLTRDVPDVLMVQEAGNMQPFVDLKGDPEPQVQKAYRIVRGEILPEGYMGWWCPWDRNDGAGNVRCSLAIFWKTSMRDAAGAPTVYASTEDTKRPVLSKGLDGRRFLTIHAGGIDYIREAMTIAQRDRLWVVAGDYNQDVVSLHHNGCVPAGGLVFATTGDQYTRPQSKRIIDYAVSNISGGIVSIVDGYRAVSDHLPVQIIW